VRMISSQHPMTEASGFGNILDGWANRDIDI
jgi:hypothetical protein